MKKFIVSTLLLAIVSFGLSNLAYAEQRVAVINIPAIMEKSPQVQELNNEQQSKMKELEKWLEVVKQDIEKQQTQEGKEKLFKKYHAEYAKKEAEIISNHQSKMQSISDALMAAIQTEAKAKGYDMVITKNIVVYGGEDITEDVLITLNTQYDNEKNVKAQAKAKTKTNNKTKNSKKKTKK